MVIDKLNFIEKAIFDSLLIPPLVKSLMIDYILREARIEDYEGISSENFYISFKEEEKLIIINCPNPPCSLIKFLINVNRSKNKDFNIIVNINQ